MSTTFVLPHLRHRLNSAAPSKPHTNIEQNATPHPTPHASPTPDSTSKADPAHFTVTEPCENHEPSEDNTGMILGSPQRTGRDPRTSTSNMNADFVKRASTPVFKNFAEKRIQVDAQAAYKSTPGLTASNSQTAATSIASPIVPCAKTGPSSHMETSLESKHSRTDNATTSNNGACSISPKPLYHEKKKKKQVAGWLTKEDKKAMAKRAKSIASGEVHTNNGWDDVPDIDFNDPKNLLDWDGNLQPAPVEWAGRRQCERDNWSQFIIEYINASSAHYVPKDGKLLSTVVIDTKCNEFTAMENGDIALKQWICEKIENQPLQSFWNTFVQSKDPELIHPEDKALDPFWLRYMNEPPFQKQIEVPEARCEAVSDEDQRDPLEEGRPVESSSTNDHWLYRRMKNQTANTTIAEAEQKRATGSKRAKKQARAERDARRVSREARIVPPPNSLRPRVDIYLRPVSIDRDLAQIQQIYEYWVSNTCYVTELQAPDVESMLQRLQDVQSAALPMIVAVEDTSNGTPCSKRKGSMLAAQEKIVGFGCADDTEGLNSSLSFCADMEIYVHKDYLHLGIGKNILDRMMYLLNPMHKGSDVVPWLAPRDSPGYWTPGGKRVVGIVRVAVHYPADERSRVVWTGEWLAKYGFTKQADFDETGIKLEKWTRMAIFQMRTGNHLDPKTVVRSGIL